MNQIHIVKAVTLCEYLLLCLLCIPYFVLFIPGLFLAEFQEAVLYFMGMDDAVG